MATYVATVEIDGRRYELMDVIASDPVAASQAFADKAREVFDATVVVVRNIARALPIFSDGEARP